MKKKLLTMLLVAMSTSFLVGAGCEEDECVDRNYRPYERSSSPQTYLSHDYMIVDTTDESEIYQCISCGKVIEKPVGSFEKEYYESHEY